LDNEKYRDIGSAKTELLFELVQGNIDSSHKTLLFSQFTSLLKQLIPELEHLNIPFEYLDGSTRNGHERVDRFNNDPNLPLFLLSLKAGGTGLNLTSADTAIIYDPWWNPATENQAADRTHRIGQKRPVTIYKLVARQTIEEKILELQESKRQLFSEVIDGAAGKFKMNIEELKMLLEK
jgi:SNF2 family DNA or RNA helicase